MKKFVVTITGVYTHSVIVEAEDYFGARLAADETDSDINLDEIAILPPYNWLVIELPEGYNTGETPQ